MNATNDDQLARVMRRIDALNDADPKKIIVDGHERSYELAYAERLSHWVLTLDPQASASLRIAARGQHVERWRVPRETFPMDRGGYLRWREKLKRQHADTVATIMQEEQCDAESIAEVERIILKKAFRTHADGQCMEDALCLIFLEWQYRDLRHKTPPEKMSDIIRKTWAKMSEAGRRLAMKIELAADDREFLAQSIQGEINK